MASNDKGLEEIPDAQIESNYDEVTDSFDSMDLKSELLRGVYAYGFERPSAIQQRAIMPIIKGESRNSQCFVPLVLIARLRQRCHCSGSVRYWKDRYFLHLCSPEARPQRQGLPGSDRCSYP
ncbi:hypothetical protein BJX62DRAFT_71518 [Aspergillus germanicus]